MNTKNAPNNVVCKTCEFSTYPAPGGCAFLEDYHNPHKIPDGCPNFRTLALAAYQYLDELVRYYELQPPD